MSIFSDIRGILAIAKVQAGLLEDIRDAEDAHARTLLRTLDAIQDVLAEIRNALTPRPAVGVKIFLGNKEVTHVGFMLQDVQKVHLTIQWVDADGNQTTEPPPGITGPPVWDTSDATKVKVVAAADGMSADALGQPVLGDAQINFSVPGTSPLITAQFPVTVVAGPPVGASIVAGTPTAQ